MTINEEIKKHITGKFFNLRNTEDLVALLNYAKDYLYKEPTKPFHLKQITYYGNPKICTKRYQDFEIKKKSGGNRLIHAPVPGLLSILRSLNFVLNCMYEPQPAATGFTLGKSIVDNAELHKNNSFVYNLDLKDFFHSFDRNRVKLGFMFEPFNLKKEREPLAFLLACLCTHPFEIEGEVKIVLPQGSPTSPTLTNILCRKLDRRLAGLSKRFGLSFSRYADDITFSSAYDFTKNQEFVNELDRIICTDQELKINPDKTRLQGSAYRQEVTGLIVNQKVNVRKRYIKQVRMWIYFWEKYEYSKANQIFKNDYLKDKGHVKKGNPGLINVLSGKLEFIKMVKGEDDNTYDKLKKRYNKLINKKEKELEENKLDSVLNILINKGLEAAMKEYKTFNNNER